MTEYREELIKVDNLTIVSRRVPVDALETAVIAESAQAEAVIDAPTASEPAPKRPGRPKKD